MAMGPEIVMPLDQIEVNKEENIREDTKKKASEGGYGEIDELAADLKTQGQLQAAAVRKVKGKYELVFGFRRYLAAKKLGWKELRVQIVDLDDAGVDWARLRENEARHNLSSYEKSLGYFRQHKQHGWSVADLSARSGQDKGTVENHLRIHRECVKEALDAFRVGQFNHTLLCKLAARTKEQQKDFVVGVGTRAGQFAMDSFREFEKLGYTWEGGEEPSDDGSEASEKPKSVRPGKAALSKAFDWAKENKLADAEHLLGWVLGKKGYGGSKLEWKGKIFDPKAKPPKEETADKDE